MAETSFKLTARELVLFHKCLSSRVCLRIFKVMKRNKRLNISAISRNARVSNGICIKHLRKLARLGIVEEEFQSGLHTFTLKNGESTRLMNEATKILDETTDME